MALGSDPVSAGRQVGQAEAFSVWRHAGGDDTRTHLGRTHHRPTAAAYAERVDHTSGDTFAPATAGHDFAAYGEHTGRHPETKGPKYEAGDDLEEGAGKAAYAAAHAAQGAYGAEDTPEVPFFVRAHFVVENIGNGIEGCCVGSCLSSLITLVQSVVLATWGSIRSCVWGTEAKMPQEEGAETAQNITQWVHNYIFQPVKNFFHYIVDFLFCIKSEDAEEYAAWGAHGAESDSEYAEY